MVFGWILGAVLGSYMAIDVNDPAMTFEIASSDGVAVHGQVDGRMSDSKVTAILVAGTGPFDRDVKFGPASDGREMIFRDLAERLTARGVQVVRYDKRGIRYGRLGADRVDRDAILTATTDTMADDLGAVYSWSKGPSGLNARCVVLVAHSEGMAHVGRLASRGADSPAAIFGIGAIMTSPVDNMRWNLTERDAVSLEMMDDDRDGRVTNQEVRDGLSRTPAAVNGVIEPYIHPDGVWTQGDLTSLRAAQGSTYEDLKEVVLAAADDAPWPSGDTPAGTMQWWKSWFTDNDVVARRLARWTDARVQLHYGELDSQVHVPNQISAAREHLLPGQLNVEMHAGLGHTLGPDVTYGPVEAAIADRIAQQVADVAGRCSP